MSEPPSLAAKWAAKMQFPFPVLVDKSGSVSASYAPPEALPDLPRYQIPIGSNLIIDRDGAIRFYALLDSAHFDAKLLALRARLDEVLKEQ